MNNTRFAFPLLGWFLWYGLVIAQDAAVDTSRGDALIATYFAEQSRELSESTFADIETLEDWTSRRETYRQQLLEMLGLSPFPKRTPLEPVTTGTVEHESGIVVENVHFQSQPGLFVTGNLYRPAKQSGPLPAILYVCGHGGVRKDGVSYGNKVNYQHHGAWFARNGYVCLTIDTIQLGELEGIHHGTYREKMWWWNNRGYTPAGVEAWNCIRALDYMQSRDEIDGDRIGVTGRSGGGAYSWWIAAIDERVRVAVPVAGITSLRNHVVDGCVEGHCDCMYMVNTYRWDYPMVAALVAPRPLLISNTDKDRIFPLDGVVDVHAKTRQIYRLYNAADRLGLQITEGPHKDTQELRVHAFRWFNRYLKDDDSLIENTAVKFFEPEQLKVFETDPSSERVTNIHESFVPQADPTSRPSDPKSLKAATTGWMKSLENHVFRGWPESPEPLDIEITEASERLSQVRFTSQKPFQLDMYLLTPIRSPEAPLQVVVLNQTEWDRIAPGLAVAFPASFPGIDPNLDAMKQMEKGGGAGGNLVWLVPRGIGQTEWSRDERTRTHIRRRFMQIGQTAATMQIYDVVRGLQALNRLPDLRWSSLQLSGRGEAAFWALYASLWTDGIDHLSLRELPRSNRDAPDLLNVSRFVEMPHVVLMASQRVNSIQLPSAWSDVFNAPSTLNLKMEFARE